MESIPFFLIARLLLGLAAGIWLARKMRGFLRWLVVRLMPVRYRVSEQSFNLQARFSAALAYLLALGVAAFIFIGLGKAGGRFSPPWVTKEETTEVRSSNQELTLPPAYSSPAYSPPPEEAAAEPKAAAPEDSLSAATVAPPPAVPAPEPPYPSAYEESGRFFVQLYAFQEEGRAWAQKQYWENRLSRRVWVGVAAGEFIPYKVLVGPFGRRQEARRYLRAHRLDGFPREQHHIRLYKD